MTRKQLEKKVINLIPSNTVKNKTIELNHSFSDLDLLALINLYCEYRDDRINLFTLALNIFTDIKIKKYIRSLINYEEELLSIFKQNVDNYIFELNIKIDPNDEIESYLFYDYESAYNIIKPYLSKYKKFCHDNYLSEYEIIKRRISNRNSKRDIDYNEELGSVDIGYKQKIKRIYLYDNKIKEPLFNGITIGEHLIEYPLIFNDFDLISYVSNFEKSYVIDSINSVEINRVKNAVYYGINSFSNLNSDDYEACIVLLDSPYVKNRTIDIKDENGYYPFYLHHIHVPWGNIELVQLNEVSNELLEDYKYTVNEWKKIINYK